MFIQHVTESNNILFEFYVIRPSMEYGSEIIMGG